MKAGYFKHYNALEARRGFDPNLTQRSSWGEKSLLLEVLACRVGNGGLIKVKNDGWIVVDGIVVRPTFLNNDTDDFLVWNLIDHDGRQWKINYLRTIFESMTI